MAAPNSVSRANETGGNVAAVDSLRERIADEISQVLMFDGAEREDHLIAADNVLAIPELAALLSPATESLRERIAEVLSDRGVVLHRDRPRSQAALIDALAALLVPAAGPAPKHLREIAWYLRNPQAQPHDAKRERLAAMLERAAGAELEPGVETAIMSFRAAAGPAAREPDAIRELAIEWESRAAEIEETAPEVDAVLRTKLYVGAETLRGVAKELRVALAGAAPVDGAADTRAPAPAIGHDIEQATELIEQARRLLGVRFVGAPREHQHAYNAACMALADLRELRAAGLPTAHREDTGLR